MRSYLGNDRIILPFLTRLQDLLNGAVPQLISTYSPANIMSFIMDGYQKFLSELSAQTSELNNLNNLYISKILSPNAQTCWTNFQKSSNEIYSVAGKSFVQYVESQSNGVQGQIDTVKSEIKQEIKTIVGLFTKAVQNPTNDLPVLAQYVSKFKFLSYFLFNFTNIQ